MVIDRDEWRKKPLPYFWIKLEDKPTDTQSLMLLQWVGEHSGGWVYWDSVDTYVFERNEDRVAFKLWMTGDPFATGTGEVL